MKRSRINERDVLAQVTVKRLSTQAETKRFNALIESEHYLKNSRVAGKVIRHVVEHEGEWIGWADDTRRGRLGLVASNSRFLLRFDVPTGPTIPA